VQLIDPDEGPIGIMTTGDALRKAQEKGLDLIEVSPKADPPVAKIIDFGKFKYQQDKKKQKTKSKKTVLKGLRLTLNMGEHDLETREKKALDFLSQGNKVQLELMLRGRQAAHTKRAFDQIQAFGQRLGEKAQLLQRPVKKGRRITVILQPK